MNLYGHWLSRICESCRHIENLMSHETRWNIAMELSTSLKYSDVFSLPKIPLFLKSWIKTIWWAWLVSIILAIQWYIEFKNYQNKHLVSNLSYIDSWFEPDTNFIIRSELLKNSEQFKLISRILSTLWIFFWLVAIWLNNESKKKMKAQIDQIWFWLMQAKMSNEELLELNNRLLQAKQELEVLLSEAKSAEKAKSVFLAAMSHELRTPLNAVIWISEAMYSWIFWWLEWKNLEYIWNINSAWNYLLELINNILDLAKIEAERFDFRLSQFELKEVIDKVVHILSIEAEKKWINISIKVPERLIVNLDMIRLEQIIMNLVKNSIKFTDNWWNISIVVNDWGDLICIDIIDNWSWIPKDKLDKLCKPFIQVDDAYVRNSQQGSWLWLYLSRRLVELFWWDFKIDSAWLWKWTTVSMYIPKSYNSDTRKQIPDLDYII